MQTDNNIMEYLEKLFYYILRIFCSRSLSILRHNLSFGSRAFRFYTAH